MSSSATQRRHMIETQLEPRGIHDQGVLAAMGEVPRERFVPERDRHRAYGDHALPIAHGQTISQPYIVAAMIQSLALTPEDRVLEVGAGSGYAAAVMSRIAREVVAIERIRPLADAARDAIQSLEYDNVRIIHADGARGWPELAPYDAISVAAGTPAPPDALIEQLAEPGRLLIPVGDPADSQRLTLIRKDKQSNITTTPLDPVRFVPLLTKSDPGPSPDAR